LKAELELLTGIRFGVTVIGQYIPFATAWQSYGRSFMVENFFVKILSLLELGLLQALA
jgi:hypothetical protein